LRPQLSDNGRVGKPAAIGTAVAIATLALSASVARAQEVTTGESARGFGERGSVLFSVENVFGVLVQTYTGANGASNPSVNDNGFYPPGFIGTRVGVNGLLSNGITLGGIVGFWSESRDQNGGSVTVFNVGPRVGWAGCLKKYKALGFWGRVGPTFQYVNLSSGGTNNGGADAWALDFSFEAFIVWSPVDHFGLLAGPSVDIGMTGHESANNAPANTPTDFGYHAIGMSFGLVFEL